MYNEISIYISAICAAWRRIGVFMKQLKASVWIMAVIAVFLVIGSILSSFGLWEGYYKSIFFIAFVAAFAAVMIWCLVFYKFSFKRLGFYLCHTGVLLIVVCSFVSWGTTKDTYFNIPVNADGFYGEVVQDDGSVLDFGFDISVASFEVEKYDAEYALYNSKTDFTENKLLIESVSQSRDGIYDMGEYGQVSADKLKNGKGDYVSYFVLDGKYTMVKLPEADKSYTADLQIRDGEVTVVKLGVNDPYTYKGWKFYLMGYDTKEMSYVNLYVKNDPGNIPFAIGIWMTIVGTFVECFSLLKRREVANK